VPRIEAFATCRCCGELGLLRQEGICVKCSKAAAALTSRETDKRWLGGYETLDGPRIAKVAAFLAARRVT